MLAPPIRRKTSFSDEDTFAPFRSLRTSLGVLQHVVKEDCDALLVYQQTIDTGGREHRDYREAVTAAHRAFLGDSVATADSKPRSIAGRLVVLLDKLGEMTRFVSEGAREWDIDKISCYVGTLVIYREHWDDLETKERKRYLNLCNACIWVLVDHQSRGLKAAQVEQLFKTCPRAGDASVVFPGPIGTIVRTAQTLCAAIQRVEYDLGDTDLPAWARVSDASQWGTIASSLGVIARLCQASGASIRGCIRSTW